MAIIIAFLQWESRGVTLFELHMKDETINYRDFFIFYLGVASITIVYSVVLSVVGFSGVTSPPPTVVRSDVLQIILYLKKKLHMYCFLRNPFCQLYVYCCGS